MSLSVPPNAVEDEPGSNEDRGSRECLSDELDLLYRSRAGILADRLLRRGASSNDGLDFIHEAFARILGRHALRQEPVERPEAYVAKISRNLLNDHGRTNGVRKRWAEHVAAIEPKHHDPVVYLESRDTLRRLEAAVMKLRPRTREIFLARRVEGLSYAEIAQLTGSSVKTVERQMSKAIAKLSRLMDRG